MKAGIKIRFSKKYGNKAAGCICIMDAPTASKLIKIGVAEIVQKTSEAQKEPEKQAKKTINKRKKKNT